jgi:hypothetical protein
MTTVLDDPYWSPRWLQASNGTTASPSSSFSPTMAPTSMEEKVGSDGQILRATFLVYGSALAVVCLLFCHVRRRYPRPFTVRGWTNNNINLNRPELACPLALDQYGFISWIWMLTAVSTDDELLDQCGLDALCFLRTLTMGYKLCLVGICNSIWLFPIYATATPDTSKGQTYDSVSRITVSHLPAASPRFVATVLAAYVLFGTTMYLVLKEFEWFVGMCVRCVCVCVLLLAAVIAAASSVLSLHLYLLWRPTEMRHKFLAKRKPRNYTVYVRNVPTEYRTDAGLERFFRSSFDGPSAVLQANLKVKTPFLAKTVQKRTTAIQKLEYAYAQEQVSGITPMHNPTLLGAAVPGATKVNSINAYSQEIKELNANISSQIQAIEEKMMANPSAAIGVTDNTSDLTSNNPIDENDTSTTALIFNSVRAPLSNVTNMAGKLTSVVGTSANTLQALAGLGGENQDGGFYSGGFVSFGSLATTNAARQMVHHATPFAVQVTQAPDPDDSTCVCVCLVVLYWCLWGCRRFLSVCMLTYFCLHPIFSVTHICTSFLDQCWS